MSGWDQRHDGGEFDRSDRMSPARTCIAWAILGVAGWVIVLFLTAPILF